MREYLFMATNTYRPSAKIIFQIAVSSFRSASVFVPLFFKIFEFAFIFGAAMIKINQGNAPLSRYLSANNLGIVGRIH